MGRAEWGRSDSEVENRVGMFVNRVAIRNLGEADKRLRGFLEEVKHDRFKDFENTDY
ncbi:hypothetical protein [Bacillus velezensis]|uniref:hypothetical protein n=1 Tax=Bacillus velezensis TaxID=492670 RepID=UPI0011A4203B|nr:hypothetical protein [Bacillus velezensis]